MPTAQETYREMMKTQVAPQLRALGFKGSGQHYELRVPRHWAMLGFQKATWSDAETVSFTVNVLVVSHEAWEAERADAPYFPERPTATTFWGEFAWQHRIGHLLPGDEDLWWEVRAGMATAELAGAVLWAVEDYAVPAMRAQLRRLG